MSRLYLHLTVPIILLSACSKTDEGSPSHIFEVTTQDGVTIAETTGGPKYSSELFDYIYMLNINQDENDPESLIGLPKIDMLMDETGSFYITDRRPNRIICYDSNGNFSHNIGRKGQGPGEYMYATVTAVGDGFITFWDNGLRRISRMQTRGIFVESIQIGSPGRIPFGEFNLDVPLLGPNHELIMLGGSRFSEQLSDGSMQSRSAAIIVLSPNADTLASLSTSQVKIGVYLRNTGQERIYFNATPIAIYSPINGIVLTTGLEPRMDIYGLDGELHRIIKVEIPPEPVLSSERDDLVAHLRQRLREAEDERSIASARASIDHLGFCDPKAVWNEIVVDEYGYFWAQQPGDRYWGMQGVMVNPTYRLFSPEGEYLGNTQCPAYMGTITRGHHIAVIVDNETGEFEIVVHKMKSRLPGFQYP